MAINQFSSRFFGALKPLRLGLILSVLLFLGACSGTTFIYNRLDFILPWYLDDYVDLNRGQKTSLDASIKPFLHWHRVDELPRYVQLVGEIEQGLDGAVTAEIVGELFFEIEQAWLRLEDEALGWLFELGAGLSDEQIQEFLQVLHEQQLDYEEEYLDRSDEKYRQDSYNNFEDGLQDHMGRLDKSQRAVLHRASAELIRMDALWLRERATWLVKLDMLLEREAGWQQKLREQKAAREENYSPQYREMYAHNLEVIQGAVASVISNRSNKQDRRLRKKLRNLKEDFETLIAEAKSLYPIDGAKL